MQQQVRAAERKIDTVAQSIQYTSLPRDDSDTEPDMESFGEQEETLHPASWRF